MEFPFFLTVCVAPRRKAPFAALKGTLGEKLRGQDLADLLCFCFFAFLGFVFSRVRFLYLFERGRLACVRFLHRNNFLFPFPFFSFLLSLRARTESVCCAATAASVLMHEHPFPGSGTFFLRWDLFIYIFCSDLFIVLRTNSSPPFVN